MSPRTGRPTEEKKTERLEIRLAPTDAQILQDCANALGISKTQVILKGIKLIQSEIGLK